ANEFLDALPVRQFVRRGKGWHERGVGLAPDGAALVFALDSAPSPSAALISPCLGSVPDGSVFEVPPAAIQLAAGRALRLSAAGTAGRLAADAAAALFIDYGHVESACGETLQAVRQHRHHPVLEAPGNADLTAHVDFQAFADAGRAAGARACGPVTQGDFLRS